MIVLEVLIIFAAGFASANAISAFRRWLQNRRPRCVLPISGGEIPARTTAAINVPLEDIGGVLPRGLDIERIVVGQECAACFAIGDIAIDGRSQLGGPPIVGAPTVALDASLTNRMRTTLALLVTNITDEPHVFRAAAFGRAA